MFRKFASGLVNFLLKLVYPIEIYGQDNIPEGRVLVLANHGHLLDPFLVNMAYKKHFFVIGKTELFEIPILKYILYAVDAFPVDRDQLDLRAIKTSIAKLKESSLLIFPEGTRNGSLIPLEGKSGAVMMAAQAGVDMLPIALVGNYKLFRSLKVFILPARSVEEFGYERLNSRAYSGIVNSLLSDIYQKLQEETNDH
ncbi:MAG: 1-acyl-sn-glycerol-3-phosphate acyltransferase [Tissierellia bacterium]|nr:1-acyl-sn-glycerol-3-phosphate acyltransferase [Tissierellia bacterium]